LFEKKADGTNEERAFKRVAVMKEGDVFGELALISMKKRAATVTCLTDCHFAVLDR